MLEKYLKDLEDIRERGGCFTEYYHKMLNSIDDLEGNDKPLFVYALLNDVRTLGLEKGKAYGKEAMLDFLNSI